MCDVSLFTVYRLTDLAQRKLTSFYGQEDNATLQNVLRNVPNVIPQLLNFASSSADDNNSVADVNVSQISPGAMSSHNLETQSSSYDCGHEGDNSAAVVQPDKHGAYVNPVITDSLNPDGIDDVGVCETTGSKIDKQQNHTLSEENCVSAEILYGGSGSALSPQVVSSSSSAQEDTLDNSTLHTFLRMVSTQSSVVIEQLESRDAADEGQSPPEVTPLSLLFLNA